MQHQSDAQLLRDYAAHGSEPAFVGIVARHTDLVYSAAWRQTGSPELAREIAQTVFADLARKARALAVGLTPDASLIGWLYRSTRYEVLTVLRDERRRQAHQRLVMEHFNPTADPAPDWQQIAPVLDEAMAELGDADREAVLLRYFQNHDFHAVGRALGVSDDAAQKRVSRAVERLRESLAQRGVTLGAQGLVVVLAANAVQAAPAGLSAALAAAALGGTTVLTTATATVGKAIAMTTTQKVLVTAALAAAVGTGIYEAREASTLRAEVETLRQQSIGQIQQLTGERDDSLRQLAALRADRERLARDAADLMKLRAEVTRLRQENQMQKQGVLQPAKTPAVPPAPAAINAGEYVLKDQLAFAGFATPEAAMQSMIWAMAFGNYETTTNALSPMLYEGEQKNPKSRESFETGSAKIAPLFRGMQVLARKDISDQQVEIKVRWDINIAPASATGSSQVMIQPMVKVGDEWKIGSSTRQYTPDWDKGGTIHSFVQ